MGDTRVITGNPNSALWRGIDKRKKGGMVGKDILKRHGDKGRIKHMPDHFQLSETTLKDNIKKLQITFIHCKQTKNEDKCG